VSAKLCTRNGASVCYVHAAWTASSCTSDSQMAVPAPTLWEQPPALPGPHYSLSTEASISGTPATQLPLTDINSDLHKQCILQHNHFFLAPQLSCVWICNISVTHWYSWCNQTLSGLNLFLHNTTTTYHLFNVAPFMVIILGHYPLSPVTVAPFKAFSRSALFETQQVCPTPLLGS
jgi:hypothetical protein